MPHQILLITRMPHKFIVFTRMPHNLIILLTCHTTTCPNPPHIDNDVLHFSTNKTLYFVTMVALHDTFASIVEACEAINRHVLNNSESY